MDDKRTMGSFDIAGQQGGVAAIEQRNIAKAKLLYDFIDSSDFYVSRVAENCRSRMNIPFFLADETRNDAFLAQAKERGLLQLKGYKTLDLQTYLQEVDEGPGHSGMSALVGLIGKKP